MKSISKMIKMKKFSLLLVVMIAVVFGSMNACSDEFLEVTPAGALGEDVLATADGVDGLLIGAYALLDGTSAGGGGSAEFNWQGTTTGWVFASIRGLVANKGTDSGDQPDINPIQTYNETGTNPYLNVKWLSVYEGISRSNATIRVADQALANGAIDQATHDNFVNQARTLRGFYHFEAWRLWADMSTNTGVPYVDVDTDPALADNTVDIRQNIIDDLSAGINLPDNMGQVGRFNKSVARVLTAKAYMQMYRDYAAAKPLLEAVRDGGTNPAGQAAALEPFYGDIFDIENRNGTESIYTVQYSVNDGSGGWNGGFGEVLNFPYKSGASPGGCCGFHQPTQEYVNSFRVDASGLPIANYAYNQTPVVNDQGLTPSDPFTEDTGTFDPRLDWSVGRRGIPYLDWGDHTGQDWVRDQSYAGPYSPKKQVYKQSQEGTFTEVGNWTSGWTANGYRFIRYSDVLLLLAECYIVGDNNVDAGIAEINKVRARAADPASWVKEADGTTDAANYNIGQYPNGLSFDEAVYALQMERKLELGMEGHRYYDLQRWNQVIPGSLVTELTRALDYEKTQPWADALYGGATVGPEDVNYPLPQDQIDLMNGVLVPNR